MYQNQINYITDSLHTITENAKIWLVKNTETIKLLAQTWNKFNEIMWLVDDNKLSIHAIKLIEELKSELTRLLLKH